MNALMGRPIVWIAGAAALVALLVIARPVLTPTTTPAALPSNTAVADTGTPPVVPVVDLRLDRLQARATELAPSERDPFRFRPAAPPPAPRMAAPPPVFVPPAPVGPPPPPAIPLKYFGVLTIGGERVASFVDARGNTFSGKEGEIIEGQYRVIRIRDDFVELAFLDGSGQQTIRLTGQ